MAKMSTELLNDNLRSIMRRRKKGRTFRYLSSLTIANLRSFGPEQVARFVDSDGKVSMWTTVIGNNGTGKTTLLQAIERSFGVFQRMPLQYAHEMMGFVSDNARRAAEQLRPAKLSMTFDGVSHDGRPVPSDQEPHKVFEVSDDIGIDIKKMVDSVNTSSANGKKPSTEDVTLALLNRMMEVAYEVQGQGQTFCCAYGAGRRIDSSSLAGRESGSRAASLFSDDLPLRSAEEWLLQLDYAANKKSSVKNRAAVHREKIRSTLIELLPDVKDIRFVVVESPRYKARVEFNTPDGWRPLDQLGYGYRTLIAWMVDFASRLIEEYPKSDDALAEPAICLVDEVDLHLHPKWQRDLTSYLRSRFPKTQFIVTAHSPLVVQGAADANVIVLRRGNDGVLVDQSTKGAKGWRIDQLLASDLFDSTPPRTDEYEDILQERRSLLLQKQLSKAQKARLKVLNEIVSKEVPTAESPQEIEAMALIRAAAAHLKKAT